MRARRTAVVALIAAAAVLLPAAAPASPPRAIEPATRLVSVAADGRPAMLGGHSVAISADGRLVAFLSPSSDLVPGDTNGLSDVFVRDLDTGAVRRVSVSSGGAEANGPSQPPAISGDGRYVAFVSEATNLVRGDTNRCPPFFNLPGSCPDVFVHDLLTGRTTRVSVGPHGRQSDGESIYVALSWDGRYVAFASRAANLVPGDTNGTLDVFRHDTARGVTERVSVGSAGEQANGPSRAPSISGDGSLVVFRTAASNLVPGDANQVQDVVLRDMAAGRTTLVSRRADGSPGQAESFGGAISRDGGVVAFGSIDALVADDRNGVGDAYVLELASGAVTRVDPGRGAAGGEFGVSAPPSISPDGRFVAFETDARLASPDRNGTFDVFLHDRVTGATTLVSAAFGQPGTGNSSSNFGVVAVGGCRVAFASYATDLVPELGGEPGEIIHAYVRDPLC